jgi:hypothetical protein
MQNINPVEGVFDAGIAGVLVRGAAAVYGEPREMEGWAEEQECESHAVVSDKATDTLALVAASRDCGFVVFRGTRDVRNWMSDLDVRRVAADLAGEGACQDTRGRVCSPDGRKVHEGFACALGSVEEELEEAMKAWGEDARTVFFAGHSLGGALAMLAGARMQNAECRMQNWVYTFGQPRVGNRAWAAWYDGRLRERSFRVVHAEDVVPRVPWLLGTFRHAGHEVFFPRTDGTDGTNGTYGTGGTALLDPSWVRKLAFDFCGLWRRHRPDLEALLADHHVDSYVKLMGAGGVSGGTPDTATGTVALPNGQTAIQCGSSEASGPLNQGRGGPATFGNRP